MIVICFSDWARAEAPPQMQAMAAARLHNIDRRMEISARECTYYPSLRAGPRSLV
jgi:hypothetical protein